MSIKKYIITFVVLLIAYSSYEQQVSYDFINRYREAFFKYAGLDTLNSCLNSVIVLKYTVTKDGGIADIAVTPVISKELQIKLKVAIQRTEELWKRANISLDTSLLIIELLYIDDDTGCRIELQNYVKAYQLDSLPIDSMEKNKLENNFVQLRKNRDKNILQSTFNELSFPQLKSGVLMLPAIWIRKTY